MKLGDTTFALFAAVFDHRGLVSVLWLDLFCLLLSSLSQKPRKRK